MVDGDQPTNRRTALAAVGAAFGVPWIGSTVAGTDRSKTKTGPRDASHESAGPASVTETETATETASDDTSPPWTRYYGEWNDNDGGAIVATDDGLVVTGLTETEAGGNDAWLFKLSEQTGEVEWSRVYEGSEVDPWPNDRTVAAIQTRDSGFALVGTRFVESGENRVLFVKTDADGRRTATEGYVAENAHGVDVLQPDSGGYALLGTDVLIRTDPDGTERWRTEFTVDEPADVSTHGMAPGHDGGYVVAGASNDRETGRDGVFAAEVRDDGEIAWSRRYDVGGNDRSNDIARTETGYALVGTTAPGTSCPDPDQRKIDALVLHLTASGERDWFRTYGSDGFDEFSSVVRTDDGGLFAGGHGDTSTDEQNFWMVKTTATGELEWSRDGALQEPAYVEDVAQTPGGQYVGVGTNETNNSDAIVANLGRPE